LKKKLIHEGFGEKKIEERGRQLEKKKKEADKKNRNGQRTDKK